MTNVGLPDTVRLVSQGLGPSRYSASSTYQTYVPSLAFDSDTGTHWSSGDYSAWIEVDLGVVRTLTNLSMMVNMSPDGQATHQVWISDQPIWFDTARGILAAEFSGSFYRNQVFTHTFPAEVEARYVQIRSFDSVSWVGWWDIDVLAICRDGDQDGVYDDPGCTS